MAARSETHGRVLVTAMLLAVVTASIAAPPPDAGWRAYQKHDYPAAEAYLSLIFDGETAARLARFWMKPSAYSKKEP